MNLPSHLIDRTSYIDRIKPFMRKDIAKVLTGQRRVGKSFLLYQLVKLIMTEEPEANIIYINLEDFAFNKIETSDDLHAYISTRLKTDAYNYIFIDEIQDVAGFEKVIRSLLLQPLNDIYITGSNAKMLSGELATYLSGRYVEFHIYSLSYLEFLQFHKLDNNSRSLDLYARYGGLPYLVNLSLNDETVNEYMKSVYSTIVFRDVVNRYNLRNIPFLERLIQFFAENIGNLFSAKNISDYLKSQRVNISVTQIQNYTRYLAEAFLIHRIERYDLVGKRIFEIGEKIYFENLGLRNIIAGYRITDKGKILENLVYNHLTFCGYHIYVGHYGDKEIDFVAQKAHEKVYIQVATRIDEAATAEREFGNLLKIQDNYPKIVVIEGSFHGNSYEGIKVCSILDFLSTFR